MEESESGHEIEIQGDRETERQRDRDIDRFLKKLKRFFFKCQSDRLLEESESGHETERQI